ncbi:MAG: hypothetical protein PHU46_15435 [Rhodocyclaceae bacterium]|nr:hypothetical protein [Rhodocyclaceae bacterium]
MKTCLYFLSLLACLWLPPAGAFDFDDLKMVEGAEREELLEKSRQAARNEDFGTARAYLNKARNKGATKKQVRAVEDLIAGNEANKARRDEVARQASQDSSSNDNATQGERPWICRLTCRTSGWGQNYDAGQVRVVSTWSGLGSELTRICERAKGGIWYKNTYDCKPE